MNMAAEQAALLERGLASLGVVLPRERQERLLAYLALLYKWNRAYNLTAIGEDRAVESHLLDSLAILPFVPAGALLDVGSGGGLPGIVLAIARPEASVTLLDGNAKKASFLRQAAIGLKLANIVVHGGRVEQYHPGSGFAAILSRAFAELKEFTALSGHLLAEGGVWLAMKGVLPQEEIARLPGDVRVDAVHPLAVPGVDGKRHLIVMRPAAGRELPIRTR